jgi:serine phosphatase RsbU (regulator of sigma subunit)/HAMP domain-containing protein
MAKLSGAKARKTRRMSGRYAVPKSGLSRKGAVSDGSGADAKPQHAGRFKPSMQGIGLAPKLMLWITLVTSCVTLVVGYSIASRTEKYIEEEILKAGIDGVKLLRSVGQGAIAGLTSKNKNSSYFEIAKDFKDAIDDSRKWSLAEFKDQEDVLLSPIMDGYITLEELGKQLEVLSLSSGASGTVQIKDERSVEGYGDLVVIKTANFVQSGVSTPVYIFEMEFGLEEIWPRLDVSSYRPDRGRALLFLSRAKVSEATDAVFFLMAMVLALAVVLSLLIAWVLARGVTRPIYRLVEDMSLVSDGDLDHVTQACSTDEVGYLSTTFNQLTRSLKVAHEAEIEKEKLEHDLSVGREIQQTLLPKTLFKIPGYDLDAFYMSAKEVGGDYYDLIPVDKTKLGVVVADVSGKGIQGAMIMTIMRTVMNIAASGNLSCKSCLARTNRFLSDRIKRGMFVTSFYAILDCKNHVLKFSSAGHNPMVIYRAATKSLEMFNPTGIALGFDKGPLFERTLKEDECTLGPGDRFVLYTDGVVEAMDEDHEEFTDQRFYDFVLAHAEEDSKTFVHKLVAELKRHQGQAPQHDDITIVTFRRN